MNRKMITAMIAMLLLVMLPVFAFADDETGAAAENALSAKEAADEITESALEETGEGSTDDSKEEDSREDSAQGIAVIVKGDGKVNITEDGHMECLPGKDSEIVSITADRKVCGISAGEQLPELELSEMEFPEGAKITVVFGPVEKDDDPGEPPASASAIF